MEKLAILGGRPVRIDGIEYGGQWIEQDDIDAVVKVLKSDLITCGPQVELFEQEFARTVNAKYAVAVSSGTAALHLAALTAGISKGDEVIVSSLTFAASANCILYCGAKPVFADINPETYNVSPQSIRENITDKTKAVIAVDFSGQAVELDEIRDICRRNNLILIEDAAHSLGTKYNGSPIGGIADLTTFSFHPVKTITGGEGGAITTNNDDYYKRLKLLRTHGITKDRSLMMNPCDARWFNEQIELGFNYRLTDFQAALLISQLNKLERFSKRRKEISKIYDEFFSEIPEIAIQKNIPESDTTKHLYIIRLNLDRLRCSRKDFFDALRAENVWPQVHYIPVYWHGFYQKLGYRKGLCPNAEKVYASIMSIPLFPRMTDQDVYDSIAAVKKVVEYYRKEI